METKPIFYGKAPSTEYQDYALTAYSYEDKDIETIEEYNYEPIEEVPEPVPEIVPVPEPEQQPEPVKEEIKKLPVTGM